MVPVMPASSASSISAAENRSGAPRLEHTRHACERSSLINASEVKQHPPRKRRVEGAVAEGTQASVAAHDGPYSIPQQGHLAGTIGKQESYRGLPHSPSDRAGCHRMRRQGPCNARGYDPPQPTPLPVSLTPATAFRYCHSDPLCPLFHQALNPKIETLAIGTPCRERSCEWQRSEQWGDIPWHSGRWR